MAFIFVLGHFLVFGYAYLMPKLEIKNKNSILLYDKDGTLFFQGHGASEWIALEEVSPYVINATVATEDKRFYKHIGFDYIRIVKAVITNVISGEKEVGASTITQQYARNLFLTFEKTWNRKIDEAMITVELEAHYTKEEILEGYLNTINYGHGCYGIESASKFYFNKSSKDLTLAEASIISGIPKSPSNYSPIINLDFAKSRQNIILSAMVLNGYITEEEKINSYNEELTFYGKKEKLNLSTIMYYQDAVMKELKEIGAIPDSLIQTGGLKIYTNLDIDAQTLLEEKIESNLSDNKDLQVASVMMNPNTGAIIALAGGRDYSLSQYNRATTSKRQVGSTMKPFLYYSALENGFTSSSNFISELTTFTLSNDKTYAPKNYAEIYPNKPISMAAALAYSDNIYAVKTHMFLGEEILVDIASRTGLKEPLQANPSLPLGTNEINITDFISSYAALANGGAKIDAHLITKITDNSGNIIYERNPTSEVVLNKSMVFILNELLANSYDYTFVDYTTPTCLSIAPKLTKKYAIKTGTTLTDVWAIGYNPDIILGVWVGYDDNTELENKDSSYPKNIWADVIEGYLLDKDEHWYEMPNNVVGVLVNPITGLPATNDDKKKKILYYIKGTEPYTASRVSIME